MAAMVRVRLLLPALVALAAVVVPAPAQAADQRVRLDGVTVRLSTGTRQVITVNHTRGHAARVTFWTRSTDGAWHRTLRTRDGRTGSGGLVAGNHRRQGSGTTPLGSYRLLDAFGTHAPDPTWHLAYRRIARGDFWVQDNRSAHYNRYRNQAEGGFRWWLSQRDVNASERLTDFPTQYEYAVNTSFNLAQVRHRGSGIFLHVNGRGATAGCVSVPRRFLVDALRRLDPAYVPVIAIGR
jgi:L,D-peptidoglycan transpeptidase YkuD (ErfK/YbiS/YcfS/YnhG family)